jgi:UDP:flavonoid glycosyltransferase YjiC (YdhE family)
VHQGSWIATHLAAQAGVPQLVLPQASDQYLWAHVVHKNGLGPRGVDMNRLRRRKLGVAFEELTRDDGYAANARALGERVRGIDGAKNAVRLFERLERRFGAKTSVFFPAHARGAVADARRAGGRRAGEPTWIGDRTDEAASGR